MTQEQEQTKPTLSLTGFELHQVSHGAPYPKITVSKKGTITFNIFARERYLKDHKRANIYYNPTTRTVAVELTQGGNLTINFSTRRCCTINSSTFSRDVLGLSELHQTEFLGTSDEDTVLYFKILG